LANWKKNPEKKIGKKFAHLRTKIPPKKFGKKFANLKKNRNKKMGKKSKNPKKFREFGHKNKAK